MADNVTITSGANSTPPAGTVIATDDVSSVHYQAVKIALGADGVVDNLVDSGQQLAAASLPVVLASDHSDIKVTLDSETITIAGTVQVQSNSANLATETTAAAIQTAVEVIDNAISGTEMQVDLVDGGPIGATTDVEATGDGSVIAILKRLRTLLGGTLTVSGTVTADAGTGPWPVTDNGASLTVDNAALSVTGGGVEATALRVTIANDSTGVVTVDGTITANLSATDNAVLDQIELNTSYGDNTGGGVESGALRVTVANDSTGLLSVDDNSGSLTVDNDDTVSTNNSTTTPLGISGNFTGTGDDCLGYTSVTVVLFADQASATDGMTFEFSSDNTNWDDTYTFTMAASETRRFQFPVTARYFRLNYTNGGTGQGAFRVQTILHRQNVLTSVHRVVDNTDPDRSATLVKSAIIAQQAGAGDFVPVQSTASGNLKVALEENDAGNLTTNTVQLGGTAISTGNGTTDAGTQRVTLSSDSTGTVTLGANDGVDVGDVDVTSVTPGTAAGNLGKAEDAAHTTGDTGVMALAVQQTADAALAGTTGDYAPLQVDETGYLKVNIKAGSGSGTEYTEDDAAAANPVGSQPVLVRADTPATITSTDGDVVAQRATNYGAAYVQVVDSSGNFINTFGGSGGTSHADDAAFSIGSASSITPTGYLADDTTPDSVDEGDVGVPRMTLTRKPYAVITDPTSENNAGVDASGHLQVDIASDSVGIGGGTQYAEDAALGATPTGTLALGNRDDALTTVTPVEGDAVGLKVNARGALWAELDLTNDVTIADGGNVISTDWNGTAPPIGAGTEAAALRVTVATDSTGVLTVDGTVTANLSATDNAVLDQIELNTSYGDNTGGGTEAGALRVTLANDSTGVLTVDNGGTFVVQEDGAALTALQLIDDVVYADDADWTDGVSKHALVGGLYQSVPQTITDGDVGPIQVDSNGNVIESNSAAILADTANMDTNLGTIAGAVAGSEMQVDVITSALPTGAATSANQSTANTSLSNIDTSLNNIEAGYAADDAALGSGVLIQGDDGTDRKNINVDATTGDVQVDVTNTVTVDLGANNDIQGDVGHDVGDSGNPVKVGGVAYNFDGTAPGTAVAEADRAEFATDVYGRQFVETAHPNYFDAIANYATAQTDTSLEAAPGAGLAIYVTDVVLSTDTAMNIQLEHGTTDIIPPMYFAANGGAAMHFRTPLRCATNTALTITSSASGNHSVVVSGFIAP